MIADVNRSTSSSPPDFSPFARRSDNRREQLLTPVSHFPSRMLPPPGTMPRVLTPPNNQNAIPVSTNSQARASVKYAYLLKAWEHCTSPEISSST